MVPDVSVTKEVLPLLNLSPRISSLCRDEATTRAITSLGWDSVSVVVFVKDTEEEAISALTGAGMQEAAAKTLYEDAKELCQKRADAFEKNGIVKTLRSLAPPPTVKVEINIAPSAAIARECADQAPHVGSHKTAVQLQAAMVALWDVLILAGVYSGIVLEATELSTDMKVQLRRLLFAQWADMPVKSLRHHVSSFRDWHDWCTAKQVNVWAPSRVHWGIYFESLKARGATVAKGRFSSMMWLQQHLEIKWGLDSAWVRQIASVSAHHVERQVAPFRISMWAVFSILALSENKVVQGLALFWMFVLGAVMRPAHLQRSRFIQIWPASLEGMATADKIKYQGKRRAFNWRAPRFSILGSDLASIAWEFKTKTGLMSSNFFLPDTAPKGSGLMAVSWLDEPMGQGKIKSLTMQMLEMVGIPEENRRQVVGLYSARRILPTLAHRMKLGEGETLDVGGWSKSSLNICQRYSEAKADEQACLRTELVLVASRALKALMLAKPNPTATQEIEWAYTEIWEYFPSRQSKKSTCNFQDAVGWCASMFPGLKFCKFNSSTVQLGSIEESESSGSESELSLSDCSDDSSLENDVAQTGGISWLLSNGKKGCLHVAHPSEPFHTLCNRKLARPLEGVGLQDALDTGHSWSPRCHAALSQFQKDWWKNAHTLED